MTHDSVGRRRAMVRVATALPLFAVASSMAEEAFPTRPIRLVVTFGVGGIADIVARHVATALSNELGVQVVVENRAGASGAIGASWVAHAPPDGYSLLVGTPSTQVINPMIFARLSYDPWKDFEPISLLSEAPVLLAIRPKAGATDLAGLLQLARANPGRLTYASAGVGTTPHLGMEMFKLNTNTDIVHIPYKSGGEAVGAVVGAQADLVIEAAAVVAPFLKSGQLVGVAAAGGRRSALLPDLKTAAEQGLPDFKVTPPWTGIAAPADVPKDRIEVLANALAKVLVNTELRQALLARGIEVLPSGVRAYRELLAMERSDWQRVVTSARVRAD